MAPLASDIQPEVLPAKTPRKRPGKKQGEQTIKCLTEAEVEQLFSVIRSPRDRALFVKPRLAYVVSYDYDPSAKRGFVFLPGKGDPFYYVNIGSVGHHGLEGNWFFPTASWEDFVRPLITNAQKN